MHMQNLLSQKEQNNLDCQKRMNYYRSNLIYWKLKLRNQTLLSWLIMIKLKFSIKEITLLECLRLICKSALKIMIVELVQALVPKFMLLFGLIWLMNSQENWCMMQKWPVWNQVWNFKMNWHSKQKALAIPWRHLSNSIYKN